MNDNEQKLYREIMQDRTAMQEVLHAGTQDEQVATVIRMSKAKRLPVSALAIADFFRDQDRELSDADLESVVGGKGNHGGDAWAWIGLPNDNITGTDEADTLYGGAGSDTISGGDGDDQLKGDGIYGTGEDGADFIDGGKGNDGMSGGDGNDTLIGGEGNDSMWGDEGDDSMSGGAGDEYMVGGYGNDSMDGGTGDDFVHGGEGDDSISGGDGNDTIDGASGNDTLTGGAGNDVFVFNIADGNDTITDFDPAEDKIQLFHMGHTNPPEISAHDGNTYIQHGASTITIENIEMTEDEVMACLVNDK